MGQLLKTSFSKGQPVKSIFIGLLLLILIFSPIFVLVEPAKAAPARLKTGYYVGTGAAGNAITGVGFRPDLVLIRSAANTAAVFKTSVMPTPNTAYTSNVADDTNTSLVLDNDGFTVNTFAAANTAGAIYYYLAIGGSDCSSTGNFCVGSYTGNGATTRNLTSVGFQSNALIVNRSNGTQQTSLRTSDNANNASMFLGNTATNATGTFIRSFSTNGFAVGSSNNANGVRYEFIALKSTAGFFNVGTYTGNNNANRAVTGVGFQPSMVLVKNSASTTANSRRPVMNFTESFGDLSSFVADSAVSTAAAIRSLDSDGFTVGNNGSVNQNRMAIMYIAFGGSPSHASSGDFEMQQGFYTGNNVSSRAIDGLGFKPDLVIIKGDNASLSVFRTALMSNTLPLGAGGAVANAVNNLDADGFTIGNDASVNSSGVVYQWQAFGGAYNPKTNSGASDFAIGTYYGNGITGRGISALPWEPSMVTMTRDGTNAANWKNTAMPTTSSALFQATANLTNAITGLTTDGFLVGNNVSANQLGGVYHWFAFKSGPNFNTGSYTGSAGAVNKVTSTGMRPEYLWVKRNGTQAGLQKSIYLGRDEAQNFIGAANVQDLLGPFIRNGFTALGNSLQSNVSGQTFWYSVWSNPNYNSLSLDILDSTDNSVSAPTFAMSPQAISFECSSVSGGFGDTNNKIRISNISSNPKWGVSIAATNGVDSLWTKSDNTAFYDYNDWGGTPAGCTDADGDGYGGKLSLNASTANITPEDGCSNSGLSLSPSTSFRKGLVDSVQLITAGGAADPDCQWDVTDLSINQLIPPEQDLGNYNIDMTLTLVAM